MIRDGILAVLDPDEPGSEGDDDDDDTPIIPDPLYPTGGMTCSTGPAAPGGAGLLLLALLPLALRRRRLSPIGLAPFLLALLLVPAPVHAQLTAFPDLQHFQLAGSHHDFVSVRSAPLLPALRPGFDLVLSYADRPLQQASDASGALSRTSGAIEGLVAGHLRVGLGLARWVEIDLSMPIVQYAVIGDAALYQAFGGVDPAGRTGLAAVGDLQVEGRFLLVREEQAVGIQLTPFVTLPTGSGAQLLGSGVPTFGALAVVSKRWDRLHAAGHVGYGFRPGSAEIGGGFAADDRILYGLGIGLSPAAVVDINLEISGIGYVGPGRTTLPETPHKAALHAPLELYLDTRIKTPAGLDVLIGGGPGITPAVGTPRFRVFAGVSWVPSPPRDPDGDGLVAPADECPDEPEDADGYRDDDGCPDPDNDGDGIPDDQDDCPDDPEDADGHFDEDGCPEGDRDGDGIVDDRDACPDEPEEMGGDGDGCPEPDRDGDLVPDDRDPCPEAAEDMDGFDDEDGCEDSPDKVLLVPARGARSARGSAWKGAVKCRTSESSFPGLRSSATTPPRPSGRARPGCPPRASCRPGRRSRSGASVRTCESRRPTSSPTSPTRPPPKGPGSSRASWTPTATTTRPTTRPPRERPRTPTTSG